MNFNIGWEQGVFFEFSKLFNDFMKEKLKIWYNWVVELKDPLKFWSIEMFEKDEESIGVSLKAIKK